MANYSDSGNRHLSYYLTPRLATAASSLELEDHIIDAKLVLVRADRIDYVLETAAKGRSAVRSDRSAHDMRKARTELGVQCVPSTSGTPHFARVKHPPLPFGLRRRDSIHQSLRVCTYLLGEGPTRARHDGSRPMDQGEAAYSTKLHCGDTDELIACLDRHIFGGITIIHQAYH